MYLVESVVPNLCIHTRASSGFVELAPRNFTPMYFSVNTPFTRLILFLGGLPPGLVPPSLRGLTELFLVVENLAQVFCDHKAQSTHKH